MKATVEDIQHTTASVADSLKQGKLPNLKDLKREKMDEFAAAEAWLTEERKSFTFDDSSFFDTHLKETEENSKLQKETKAFSENVLESVAIGSMNRSSQKFDYAGTTGKTKRAFHYDSTSEAVTPEDLKVIYC